ncbi:hypothetical protein IF188_10880 [Microbacterium sp. NEAU-LLC]|uniref:Uncharacterized protein n=1 Tax=Microbacterium helvum TaxID=2773713 RepID=A0ABR8NNF8_9MICO|nr:hypothetical protein [Microbacterium helvum]MBD3942199.1 hypothetical protein [Microbacterium helvum]
MRIAGVLPPDAPNPMDGLRDRVHALPFPVMGLVAQPSIEDFGGFGLAEGGGPGGTSSITVSVTYMLWRNPDDRDDPVNLAELDDATRAALDMIPPWPRPAWLIESAQRLRYPHLIEVVRTTWDRDASEYTTLAHHLVDHVNHILMNCFREELGLPSGPPPPGYDPFGGDWRATPSAVNPTVTLVVDGAELTASEIDTDPFVYAIGARLAPDRIATVVIPRHDLPYVRLALATVVAPPASG